MDALAVSGAFMITIGHGAGPEVVAFISASAADGTPISLEPERLEIFTGLTAMFGTGSFACDIVDVESTLPPPAGFVGLILELRSVSEVGHLASLGVAALGVIVTTDTARGQGVIASAGAAKPQTWWLEKQPGVPQ